MGYGFGGFLVVVGLVLDLLRSLGSAIDRHIVAEEPGRVAPPEPTDARQEVAP